jgi:predicted ATPase
MLRKFTVNNFKSLINVTYEPGTVNLLVGVNNSGKTNLCQALRFFSQTARGQGVSLLNAWRNVAEGERTLATNVYFDHPTIDLSCRCDLAIDDEALTFHYSLSLHAVPIGPLGVVAEQLHISGGSFGTEGITLLENKAGEIRLLNEERFLAETPLDACYQDTIAEKNATMLSRLYDWRVNRRAIAFRDYLTFWQYYNLDAHRLRDDHFDPQAFFLTPDGSNLASALFHLKSYEERSYRRFVGLIQQIEPRFDALNFFTIGERIQMELTDVQDNRFGPANISDGTLRFMALCYVMLTNARWEPRRLTIIEEPETGLYVRYLKPLFELIDPSGAGGQYIFTSHSPYFIDLFDAYPENITVMQDRGTYSALTKPDPARVRKYLEEMPLGELHFREMLA